MAARSYPQRRFTRRPGFVRLGNHRRRDILNLALSIGISTEATQRYVEEVRYLDGVLGPISTDGPVSIDTTEAAGRALLANVRARRGDRR